MNIIILGAGGLGRNLATTLCDDKHDEPSEGESMD